MAVTPTILFADGFETFFFVVFFLGFIGVLGTILIRTIRGDVWVQGPWNDGYWIPRRNLDGYDPKLDLLHQAPRIRRRARKMLPRKAKYLCFSCDGQIPAGSNFCPQCGEEQKNPPPVKDLFPSRKRSIATQEAINGSQNPVIPPPPRRGRRPRR